MSKPVPADPELYARIKEDTPRTARSLSAETKKKMIKLKQKARQKTVYYGYQK